jgi:signal transduction histidine kinase
LTLINDITDRRAQDHALAEAIAELALINEELAEFAAVAAHDLAAPLRAITGFAELLDEEYADALGERGKQWVGYVRAESDRMRGFIDDLLAYSRAGTLTAPAGEVDLGTVASSARNALRAEIAKTGARVEIGTMPVAAGDATALGQVFQNLLANALKFHAADHAPRVRIDALRDDEQWIVRVADDGPGIDHDERDRIFAPFHRASGAADVTGHGLGLTICRRIVERHGGRIWVEPGEERGSRFCFSLPASG